MSSITVLRPDSPRAESVPLTDALRPPATSVGLRLTIIENGKPKAKPLLEAIADHLSDDLDGLRVETVSKSSASWPIETELAREIAARSDLVLTGLGDCGGCSANSVADAIILEKFGVPATTIITEPFQGLAASYSIRLGAPGYACVILPHPVSSRSDSELEALAAKAAPQVVRRLVSE